MADKNRLQRALEPIERLPAFARGPARTLAIRRTVPFVGTAGIVVEELTPERAAFRLPLARKVSNHIQGMHAAATALLAETATGLAFGMHVRDDAIPLLKSMELHYVKVASGGLHAEAWLDPADLARIAADPRGDVAVGVRVTDDQGVEPVTCTFVWAWVPKKRKD